MAGYLRVLIVVFQLIVGAAAGLIVALAIATIIRL
jgi:hypothetical protein